MRLPLFWMTDYVDPGLAPSVLAERLAMTGTEVDRVYTHGVTALENFVVGRVLEREQHPDADRLSVCKVADRRGRRGHDRLRRAQRRRRPDRGRRAARRGDARRHAPEARQAPRRAIGGHDPGRGRGRDRPRPRRDHGALATSCCPGTPLADVLPIATDVLELEITSNRPDCLSIYGAAREVHAATGAPLNPPPWLDDPGHAGPGRGRQRSRSRRPTCARASPRGCSRTSRSARRRLAEGAADGLRPAPDQQRRRHHQLRDAADRPAAARVRLRPRRRRPARRPPGERRREDDDARRRRAHADADMGLICDDDGPDVDRRRSWAASAPRCTTARRAC